MAEAEEEVTVGGISCPTAFGCCRQLDGMGTARCSPSDLPRPLHCRR